MATNIVWNLTSTLASFGSAYSGDTVAGAASMVDTNRLVSALAVGAVKESQLADALAGGYVLSVGGTLTAARTATFPDASLTVAGQNYANVFTAAQTVRVAGGLTVQQASTQDAVALVGRAGGTSSYVATITPGTLTGSVTLTLPVSATTLGGLAITQSWTGTNTYTQQIVSSLATGTAPFSVASTTLVANLYAARSALADTVTTNANLTGPITSVGNATAIASQTGTGTKFVVDTSPTLVTPNIGAATGTSLSVSGQLTSTVSTGTAPLVVSSTTAVANLNASLLLGSTWASPAAIGTGTPAAGTFSSVTNTGLGTNQNITYSGGGGLMTTAAGFVVVGTPSATAPSTAANGPASVSGGGLVYQAADGQQANLIPVSFGNGSTASSGITGFSAQGTAGAPAATALNDTMFLGMRGFDGTNFVTSGASINFTAGSTWSGTNKECYIQFATTPSGSTTKLNAGRVDPNQVLVWGAGVNSDGTFSGGTQRPHIQTSATSSSNANMAQVLWSNNATGPIQILAKSRGTTANTHSVVTAADQLGLLSFQGDDGTNFVEGAQISAACEGVISSGVMPGRLRFFTHNSAGTLAQAMAIDSSQVLILGPQTIQGQALYSGTTLTPLVQQLGTTDAASTIAITRGSANASGGRLILAKQRNATFATMTVVSASDTLGTVDFQGSDGTNYVSGAQITATATGTPASTRMGSSLIFKTATDAAPSVMTTALTIDNAQKGTFAAALQSVSMTITGLTSGRVPVAGTSGLIGDFSTFTYTSGSGISVDGITIADAKNIVFNTSTGTKIGTGTTQKIGFYNSTPVVQPATTGTATGFTAGAGTAVQDVSTFTGGTGSTAYRISDIVLALKNLGLLAA